MKNIKLFDRRLGFSLGAMSILFGTMAPAIVPAFASADSQITSRSVAMSSSAPYNASTGAGSSVKYNIKFTPNEGDGSTAYYVAVEFCSNTPLVGSSCTAPTGMIVGTAAGGTGTMTGATLEGTSPNLDTGANYFVANFTPTADTASTIEVSSVRNPSTTGTFYARILIFDNQGEADAIDGTGETVDSHLVDDGSVALSTSTEIGVQAAVLESLQFCVFGDPGNTAGTTGNTQFPTNASGYVTGLSDATKGPAENCVDSSNGSPSPSVKLGQGSDIVDGVAQSDNITALSTSTASYAADWAQLSTNANTGAVVYLKTNNTCVGLSRDGGTSCQIHGADYNSTTDTTGGKQGAVIAANTQPGFGLQFGSAESAGSDSSGTLSANSQYTSNKFAMLDSNATTDSGGTANGTGLTLDTTSTYGGYVFGSNMAPVADQDMPFALGAAITNGTPAGLYKANLDLIAVGTF